MCHVEADNDHRYPRFGIGKSVNIIYIIYSTARELGYNDMYNYTRPGSLHRTILKLGW